MLRPILTPILKSPLNPIIGGALKPVINYVARLNGDDQSWVLSGRITIPENTDFTLEVKGSFDYGDSTSWTALVNGSGGSRIALSKTGGIAGDIRTLFRNTIYNSGIVWIEGESKLLTLSRSGSTLTLNYNGQSYTFNNDGFFLIEELGSIQGASDFADGYYEHIKVTIDSVLTNEIHFTNKDEGATQVARVGSVNATMANFSTDVWEVSENANS